MTVQLIRTDSTHAAFMELVRDLDRVLAKLDGEQHGFYAQFNKIDAIRHALVLTVDGEPVACGAFKPYDAETAEIKRMYVRPEFRGRGLAMRLLMELETWAGQSGFTHCILETGKRQPQAIGLYKKAGYALIPNYGQYAGIENSVCMKKAIRRTGSDSNG